MRYIAKNRKKIIAYGFLLCALCLAVVGMGTDKGDSPKLANAEYVTDGIPSHDGDVLVDSLSIAAVPGTKDAQITSGAAATVEGSSVAALTVTSDDVSELKNVDTYFDEVRATISMDRNQIISMLTDVIEESKNEAEKQNASEQKLKIIGYMEKEKMIENLLATKDMDEVLVLITDNAVNVTVKKQNLTQSDVAKILDIVMRETEREAEDIIIQSKY